MILRIYNYFCAIIIIMKKNLSKHILTILILLIPFIAIISCKKEIINTDSSFKLKFSSDTIIFDTVFTTIGSVTKQLKVFNTGSKKINISSIRLSGSTKSNFSINVDGIATTAVNNIEIYPNDSIFIFVKVTVDPTNSNSPLVVSDSIMFETNGNHQQVQLVAWGQDAYYHTPDHFFPNFPPFSIISCNDIWKNDKPHIIYGYAVVDSACTLTITKGTNIHLHKNAVLWIYKDGCLKVQGTLGNPVIFQGDRLENYYDEKAGQWGKIWLSAGSINNEINYAIIKNGYIGLHVDTTSVNPTQPTLKISNTIIRNMGVAGIFAQGSWIEAKNCIVSNCAQYAIFLNIGGKYNFRHCTIGNYWTYSNRHTPSLVLNNWYEDINGNIILRDLIQSDFNNCIIYGLLEEEILLDKKEGALFNYHFNHCLLKTKLDSSFVFNSNCTNCIINKSPEFIDAYENDYQLKPFSFAIDKGSIPIGQTIPFDILRHNRTNDLAPDMGAYEWFK